MKHNPYFLQVSEVINADIYLTVDASKINEDDDNMNISEKEYQKTADFENRCQKYQQKQKDNMETNI